MNKLVQKSYSMKHYNAYNYNIRNTYWIIKNKNVIHLWDTTKMFNLEIRNPENRQTQKTPNFAVQHVHDRCATELFAWFSSLSFIYSL